MLTQPIQDLIARLEEIRDARQPQEKGELPVEVNALVSSAAAFYEKVRYLVDYREEHTIRRSAIERILKRRVLIEGQLIDGFDLLKELAEGQYIPHEDVTEEKGRDITHVVARFLQLDEIVGNPSGTGRRLLSLAASEIEHSFASEERLVDEAVVAAFFKTIRSHVSVQGYDSREIDVQLFLACNRALLGTDNDGLWFALWLMNVPQWREGRENGTKVASNLREMLASMEQEIKNPLQWQLIPKIKNETIYFHVIRELIRAKGGAAEWAITATNELDAFTKKFLEEKYIQESERLQKNGTRAVAYLFCTKFIAAFVFELPYELFILGSIHYVPLLTNTLFHPLLLLASTRSVGALDSKNTELVIAGIHDCIYRGKMRSIRIEQQFSIFTPIFGLVYLLLMLLLFLGIIGVLGALQFNIVSIVLFLVFLALVSYFAFRIRYNAYRWKVSGKEGALSVLTHILAIPIVRAGRFLSQTFSSINVLVLFMDFIIETPFKLLLNFSSKFIIYLREKAEDVY